MFLQLLPLFLLFSFVACLPDVGGVPRAVTNVELQLEYIKFTGADGDGWGDSELIMKAGALTLAFDMPGDPPSQVYSLSPPTPASMCALKSTSSESWVACTSTCELLDYSTTDTPYGVYTTDTVTGTMWGLMQGPRVSSLSMEAWEHDDNPLCTYEAKRKKRADDFYTSAAFSASSFKSYAETRGYWRRVNIVDLHLPQGDYDWYADVQMKYSVSGARASTWTINGHVDLLRAAAADRIVPSQPLLTITASHVVVQTNGRLIFRFQMHATDDTAAVTPSGVGLYTNNQVSFASSSFIELRMLDYPPRGNGGNVTVKDLIVSTHPILNVNNAVLIVSQQPTDYQNWETPAAVVLSPPDVLGAKPVEWYNETSLLYHLDVRIEFELLTVANPPAPTPEPYIPPPPISSCPGCAPGGLCKSGECTCFIGWVKNATGACIPKQLAPPSPASPGGPDTDTADDDIGNKTAIMNGGSPSSFLTPTLLYAGIGVIGCLVLVAVALIVYFYVAHRRRRRRASWIHKSSAPAGGDMRRSSIALSEVDSLYAPGGGANARRSRHNSSAAKLHRHRSRSESVAHSRRPTVTMNRQASRDTVVQRPSAPPPAPPPPQQQQQQQANDERRSSRRRSTDWDDKAEKALKVAKGVKKAAEVAEKHEEIEEGAGKAKEKFAAFKNKFF